MNALITTTTVETIRTLLDNVPTPANIPDPEPADPCQETTLMRTDSHIVDFVDGERVIMLSCRKGMEITQRVFPMVTCTLKRQIPVWRCQKMCLRWFKLRFSEEMCQIFEKFWGFPLNADLNEVVEVIKTISSVNYDGHFMSIAYEAVLNEYMKNDHVENIDDLLKS